MKIFASCMENKGTVIHTRGTTFTLDLLLFPWSEVHHQNWLTQVPEDQEVRDSHRKRRSAFIDRIGGIMSLTRRELALTCAAAFTSSAARNESDRVSLVRVPQGGLQPQAAMDDTGTLHLLYLTGDPGSGDIWYVQSADRGASFSKALRVNSQPGSAIATGTIRGAQLTLGEGGRVHVAWNGSQGAEPKGPLNPDSGKAGTPMLYTRLANAGGSFEPQRNLMHDSFGLDGGGSIAADREGRVYVAWHGIGESEAKGTGREGEARRRVWLTRSEDDGRTFSNEAKAWAQATGTCGCCSLKVFAGRQGGITMLYRSATESVHRDIYLLRSTDHGKTFQGRQLHKWDINACPMSSMDIAENDRETACAWETGGQIYWLRLPRTGSIAAAPTAAPGQGMGRKHPRIALAPSGEMLLVWTEGTGWQKGGSLAWQLFDREGAPIGVKNQLAGIPVWSFAAAVTMPGNRYSIVY